MENLVNMKKEYEKEFIKEHAVHISYSHVFFKAISQALMKYPKVNASNFQFLRFFLIILFFS